MKNLTIELKNLGGFNFWNSFKTLIKKSQITVDRYGINCPKLWYFKSLELGVITVPRDKFVIIQVKIDLVKPV